MSILNTVEEAQNLPSGARFYRCALQINPYAYLLRHRKTTVLRSEEDYNAAMVSACKRVGVKVVAITDHQRCNTGKSLAEALRAAGIIVFPGAEVETKEGVHMLLLFEPNDSWDRV